MLSPLLPTSINFLKSQFGMQTYKIIVRNSFLKNLLLNIDSFQFTLYGLKLRATGSIKMYGLRAIWIYGRYPSRSVSWSVNLDSNFSSFAKFGYISVEYFIHVIANSYTSKRQLNKTNLTFPIWSQPWHVCLMFHETITCV